VSPRRRQLIATIDQGSTSTKGAVYDTAGRKLDELSFPVHRQTDGTQVTHDPEQLAASVFETLETLLLRHSISAIGLTCQRSTCLLWERKTSLSLTEARSWQDRSQAHAAARLSRHERDIARRTGLRLSPHYAALKLASLLRRDRGHKKGALDGTVVAGTLDAFLMHRLTGRPATEPSHAGRTLLFNLLTGRWDPKLSRLFGIPETALPELRPSAGRWGSYRGIPVTGSIGDQQAALLGHGGWRRGIAATHFGTGAFVLTSTGSRVITHSKLLSAALATTRRTRRYQLEGSVNSAGAAIDWAARLARRKLGKWHPKTMDPEELPRVFPAFAGAATPWWEPRAAAVVAGIHPESGGDEILAATVHAVAMRVLDCIETFADAGVPTRKLRVSGKLTRLEPLVSALADVGQIEVRVSEEEETGLLGVSRLALAGLEGKMAPLTLEPGSSRLLEPTWPAERARRERKRWRTFVARALAHT